MLLGLFDELSLSLPVREHVWLGRSLEARDVDIPLLAPLALFGLVYELALSLPVLEHVWLGSKLGKSRRYILAPLALLRLRDLLASLLKFKKNSILGLENDDLKVCLKVTVIFTRNVHRPKCENWKTSIPILAGENKKKTYNQLLAIRFDIFFSTSTVILFTFLEKWFSRAKTCFPDLEFKFFFHFSFPRFEFVFSHLLAESERAFYLTSVFVLTASASFQSGFGQAGTWTHGRPSL